MNLKSVWDHINKIHKDLKINDGFKLQLMQYEKKVFGENSIDFYKKRATRVPKRFEPVSARAMR